VCRSTSSRRRSRSWRTSIGAPASRTRCARLVEQLHHAGQQVVLVDPKGDQWGLRSAADGKAPGLPFVILGGERADVPLEVGAGEVVAKLVVEERVSVVLDLSLFRKHEVATFMTAFMENLYRLKAKEIYRTPVMLVVDEADAVAPQKPQKGEERMLGAAEDIVRRGGQRGIGCVLVSQRSAVLNKNVLTQAQILVVLRTIAPQDLAAMKSWIDVHGDEAQGRELMESLPSLPTGDAWVWSPGWPTADGIFKRVHVLPIETFDSGATPKPGEQRREPKQVADVDLDALKRQMAATIEKAKADDPRELRKQIADLKKQLVNSQLPTGKQNSPAPKTVEKFVLKDGQLARAEKVVERCEQLAGKFSEFEEDLRVTAKEIRDAIEKTVQPIAGRRDERTSRAPAAPAPAHRAELGSRVRQPSAPRATAADLDSALSKGERTVLIVLAQRSPAAVPRQTVTALTGYKRSTRDLYLQQLARRGFTADDRGDVAITDDGLVALGGYDPLPTGSELAAYWLAKLPEGERRVLARVLTAGGAAVDRDAISDATGYKRSTRDLYIQQLARRQVIHVDRDGVRANSELFD
jgi:hypothetical protein